jgi:taurine transport system permease protein
MKLKFASFISIACFILLWLVISVSGLISPRFLPSPGSIVVSLYHMIWEPFASVTLQGHIWASIRRFIVAFIVATGIAIPLGAWMGWNEKINAIVSPVFEVLRFIPPIAWVPFAILWFRLGLKSECFIIAIGIFVPCLVNSRAGIRFVDPVLIQAARTLGAKGRDILWHVSIPWSLPIIVGGVRIGMGLGWMCLVAAEMISRPTLKGSAGLGAMIEVARVTLSSHYIIGGMLIIGVLGILMDLAASYFEKKLGRWREV